MVPSVLATRPGLDAPEHYSHTAWCPTLTAREPAVGEVAQEGTARLHTHAAQAHHVAVCVVGSLLHRAPASRSPLQGLRLPTSAPRSYLAMASSTPRTSCADGYGNVLLLRLRTFRNMLGSTLAANRHIDHAHLVGCPFCGADAANLPTGENENHYLVECPRPASHCR